jgi:membrane associated rhomboid family serine protease
MLRADGMAWVMLSALLCLASLAVTAISAGSASAPSATAVANALDWQPALGLREPWRLWTCAWVHGSAAHLLVNLAGGAVVAFVGWRACLQPAAAIAWLIAWPGTTLLMAAVGSGRLAAVMPHYFGLSGVLHAGVVVLGLSLAWPRAGGRRLPLAEARSARERWIGGAILVGTLAKVASEAPWELAPRTSQALGIAVAPVAHACGIGAGLLAWAAVRRLVRHH